MARIEVNGCVVDLKFFATFSTGYFFCDVFLRLSAGGQVFPSKQIVKNRLASRAEKHGLDPTEWWYGWDCGGTSYIAWIEDALEGKASTLEPTEEYHFGQIIRQVDAIAGQPESCYFILTIGIDSYAMTDNPEICIGTQSGPSLTLSVSEAQLIIFRDQMLGELEPQWREHVVLETWRDVP